LATKDDANFVSIKRGEWRAEREASASSLLQSIGSSSALVSQEGPSYSGKGPQGYAAV